MNRLQQQLNFLLEVDKEKTIKRQTRCTDHHMENDAEHAWHIALAALILAEYSNQKIDMLKTISMLLIHDLVEIDAGDTYAYAKVDRQAVYEKERMAANRIFSILPKDQKEKFIHLWKEFEEGKTNEAKFAHAMDNIQPAMLNHADDGYMWKQHKVSLSKILKRQEGTKAGSNVLYDYILSSYLQKNVEKGNIIKDCEISND